MSNEGLCCKRSYLAVLGCLMQDPNLVNDIDRPLERSDFNTEPFYELLYVAIYNLAAQGCATIDEFTIDAYLSQYQNQYKIFQDNNGLEYISSAKDMADLGNYDYFYHRLRKYSLLRYYEKRGYDTRSIYDTTIVDASLIEKEQTKFDNLTEEAIVDSVETDLVISPKMKFCNSSLTDDHQAGERANELIDKLMENPDCGVPLTSPALNTVCRGMRKGKFYLRSSTTAGGKSRQSIMDAVNISVNHIYNPKLGKFEYTGFCEPTLFISTEMDYEECQTIIIAAVSKVDEEHILYGEYKEGELERVRQANEYIQSAPLYVCFCPDFNMQDIENIIKRYHNTYGVDYVFFDYIHTSLRLMSEIGTRSGVKLQEYQILTVFATRLKAIAELLHIFILSSTQLNAEAVEARYKDGNLLQGSKAISNKLDIGVICLKPTQGDIKKIEPILHKMINCPTPNLSTHVYKVRRGKLTRIIIHSYIDLGTMTIRDLFITDFDYNLLDIDFTKIEHVDKAIAENSVPIEESLSEEYEEEETSAASFDW